MIAIIVATPLSFDLDLASLLFVEHDLAPLWFAELEDLELVLVEGATRVATKTAHHSATD